MPDWNEFLHFLDPWVGNVWAQAAIIVLGSAILAKIVDLLLSGWIRSVAKKTATDIDDRIIELLHRPVFVSVLLLGMGLSTLVLELHDVVSLGLVRALITIAILVWSIVATRIVALMLEVLSRFRDRFQIIEPGTIHLFDNLGKVVIWGAASYFILLNWNINVSAWLASAGIVGIAVGFAAKDTIANLFAGVFILADKPYEIGDFVNLDSGERGQVVSIGLRTTRLLTRDDIEITLPNAVIAQEKIVNETGGPSRHERIRVKVGVAYGTDIDEVEACLLEIAGRHEEILESPEPRVRFRSFGESALDFELLAWISEPVLRGRLLHELNRDVYKSFASRGIQIPFPQRQIHLSSPESKEHPS